MDINNLIKENPNINITIKADELMQFAEYIITKTRQEVTSTLKEDIPERYLTRAEVCKALNVTFMTLYNWNKSGYLQAIKIGKTVKYKETDINKLLNH